MSKAISSQCPVCGYHVAVPFFSTKPKPLAMLAWPASSEEAQNMPLYPLDFVQCLCCTHIFNNSFVYGHVPYSDNPNRMLNTGIQWKQHLAETRELLLRYIPVSPTIVEIGCGEGHFVRGLSETLHSGRFVGFDPNTSAETGNGVEFFSRLFVPEIDIELFKPDAIIVRHVLEHFLEIAGLLESMAFMAGHLDKDCYLFAEVPCIDNTIRAGRLADFYYEHVSHFTTRSFHTLMHSLGELETFGHGYDGEVVYAVVRLRAPANTKKQATFTQDLYAQSQQTIRNITQQIDALAASGKKVAIWGGTGKCAAFINLYNLDAQRFSLVVDSDKNKMGTYVPGTGQRIQWRDVLLEENPDVVLIPNAWRAKDVVLEMASAGIKVDTILIEHGGQLELFAADCGI